MNVDGKPANMAQVYHFLAEGQKGYTMSAFRTEWQALSDKDKNDLRNGIGDGTLSY